MNDVKIDVRFKKDIYPYREGDIGKMKESVARGLFADDVEIIGDNTAETENEIVKTEEKPAETEETTLNSSVPESDDTTQGEEEKSVVEAPENKSMADRKTKNSK